MPRIIYCILILLFHRVIIVKPRYSRGTRNDSPYTAALLLNGGDGICKQAGHERVRKSDCRDIKLQIKSILRVPLCNPFQTRRKCSKDSDFTTFKFSRYVDLSTGGSDNKNGGDWQRQPLCAKKAPNIYR